MALVVVSKPSGFRPIGTGTLDYVFSQASIPGVGYHIEIQFNGLTLPTLKFYPDTSGVITCGVAPSLRAAVRMSASASVRLQNTYVKYQEVWDAGSNAQVPLSSDIIYFYVGSDTFLNHRTYFAMGSAGGNYLYGGSTLKTWTGRTAYLDFISDGTLSAKSGLYISPTSGTGRAVRLFDGTGKFMFSNPFIPVTGEDGLMNIRTLTWVAETEAEHNVWKGVTVSSGPFGSNPGPRLMAVSNNGTNRAMHSDDGNTWVSELMDLNPWNDVTCGNGIFVAVAPTGTFRVAWTDASAIILAFNPATASEANAWQSVAFGNGTFVAVSNNGTHRAMTSPNGQTWTNRTIQAEAWTKVRYVGGLFIAISSSSTKMSTSTDGITWTARTVTKTATGVAYGNGIYVTVGSSASPEGQTSTDGITWTTLDLPLASAAWSDIAFGEGTFSLVTSDGIIRQSVDMTEFLSFTAPTSNSWNALTYGNGYFIGVGDSNSGATNGVMKGESTLVNGSQLPVTVAMECANPLYLKWLNIYGGLSTWLFDYNQIYNMIPESTGAYKKMIVFLQGVTLEQWEAIQDLNRSGAEIQDNKKVGAYVVDFTDEDNVINIFVEPNPSSTLTKSVGHNAQLVLRYPIIDNILIS